MPNALTTRFRNRHRGLMLALLLGALLVYLAGNGLFTLVDRDEPRYAQASRQMFESGDWTVPKYLDTLRLKKPILIYWLQASSMNVFGDTPFAARFPSVLGALAVLGTLAIALPRIIGHRRTFWAIFIFSTALLPAYLAKVCMTDAVLHATIVVPMLCLYSIWRGTAKWWTFPLMGVFIGLSMLTKGPPVFLFLGMTLLALWVLSKTIEPGAPRTLVDAETIVPRVFVLTLLTLGIAVLVCLPWVNALETKYPGALMRMFTTEVVERGTWEQEGHGGPFGFYAVTFWGTYFPWCLLWPAALVQGWKRRHLPWVRFSLAAVLGPWLFLEIYKTKLPHYWLPSYPFMAILTADALLRSARGRIVDLLDRPFLIATAVWAGAAALLGVFVLMTPLLGDRTIATFLVSIALALGLATYGWGVFWLLRAKRILPAALTMGLGFWAILAFVTSVFAPAVPALNLSKRVGEQLHSIGATVPGQVQMIGYKEPSLAFYQGGTIREQSAGNYFETHAQSEWPRWTVMDDETLKLQPPAVMAQLIPRGTFRGANFAKGRLKTTVYVFEKKLIPATIPTTLPAQPTTQPTTRATTQP